MEKTLLEVAYEIANDLCEVGVVSAIATRDEIKKELEQACAEDGYVAFEPADYVDNPVALARIKSSITQEELAVKRC